MTDYDGETDNVQFDQINRFEGRSSYFHYYPTDSIAEQRLESDWHNYQHKKLMDKRRDEESK